MKYLAVILLPREISDFYKSIQQKYKSDKWNISLPPHITIIPPSSLLTSVAKLFETFRAITNKFDSFKIHIVGVDKFSNINNTVFAKVDNDKNIAKFHKTLILAVKKHLKLAEDYPLDFVPHIALSNHLSKVQSILILPKIDKLISVQEFIVENLVIFCRKLDEKKWVQLASFSLRKYCGK